MVGFEETYLLRYLQANIHATVHILYKMALKYVSKEIKDIRQVLNEYYCESLADDYNKYIESVLIYKNNLTQ